jgi:acyl-CoA thioester hydrolase
LFQINSIIGFQKIKQEKSLMYSQTFKIHWAGIDANGHLRNTAYSELATNTRFSFFADHDFSVATLAKHQMGPVITREDIRYFREVTLLESVTVSCQVQAATADYAKFEFFQQIKKENGKVAAQLIVEGMWLDLVKRRPASPFPALLEVCKKIPLTDNFKWLD